MSDKIRVKFWGVRGSYPVPGPSTVHFGGNTACVEVRVNNHVIIFDAGTGIINLGRSLIEQAKATDTPVQATLLFSHMHHDHTQGFPFFLPAYNGATRLDMFGPGVFERDLEGMLSHAMIPPGFPLALQELNALKVMTTIRETDVVLLGGTVGGTVIRNLYHDVIEPDTDLVRIRALRSHAHPDGVMIYRLDWRDKALIYATDIEGYVHSDQRLVGFSRGADLLIHDAQYTEDHYLGKRPGFPSTQGWGHSTAAMACAVAKAAEVKQLALFHHEPQYDDKIIRRIEVDARKLFAPTVAAYEGLEIEL